MAMLSARALLHAKISPYGMTVYSWGYVGIGWLIFNDPENSEKLKNIKLTK